MSQPAPQNAAPDPLIDEIRQYRADLDKRFAGDWAAYGAFIRQSAAKIREEFSLKSAAEDNDDQPANARQ
jgi:hypothetical protein